MTFKFCDLEYYSAMNLESFLDRNEIKFIKDETSDDQIERIYDITITSNDISIYAHHHYVHIGIISEGVPIYAIKIHVTEFSELKIF